MNISKQLELHKLQINSLAHTHTHMLGRRPVNIEGVVPDYEANL